MRNLRARKFTSGVLGLVLSLVLLAGVGTLWPAPANAASTVTIGIDPPICNVEVNKTFTLDIEVTITASENVAGVQAYIDFDATKLEVESITNGADVGAWTEFQRSWDNGAGTIDYAVGAIGTSAPNLNQTFVLATIEFKALAVTNSTALNFVTTPGGRETIVSYGGESVLDGVTNGEVRISLPAVRLEVTGNSTMTAGGSNELTITAKDENSGVAYGYSGVKNLTFFGPGVVPGGQPPTVEGTVTGSVTAVNFTDGISNAGAATLIAYKAETTTVNVSDSSINSTSGGYGLNLIVNPLAVSKLAFITTAQTITAGQPSAVMTVQAQDVYGNPVSVTNATVNLTTSNSTTGKFYSDAAGSNLTTSVSISSGASSASFYYKDTKAGSLSITAAESPSQGWTDASQAENVKAAAASKLVVSGITDPVKAGTACSVTVTAIDAYGNTDTTYAGTIHFTSSDSKATLPGNYTFVAATDNGSHSFVGGVILETAGEQSMTATDTVTSSITGQQTEITVTGGGGGTPWVAIIGGILGGLLVIGIIVYLLWIRKRT